VRTNGDEEDSEDEYEEGEEERQEQEQEQVEQEQDDGLRPSNVKELRDLLDEIRRMSVTEPVSVPLGGGPCCLYFKVICDFPLLSLFS
jgi:hypothetical protein